MIFSDGTAYAGEKVAALRAAAGLRPVGAELSPVPTGLSGVPAARPGEKTNPAALRECGGIQCGVRYGGAGGPYLRRPRALTMLR